jgi:hypothetical protein
VFVLGLAPSGCSHCANWLKQSWIATADPSKKGTTRLPSTSPKSEPIVTSTEASGNVLAVACLTTASYVWSLYSDLPFVESGCSSKYARTAAAYSATALLVSGWGRSAVSSKPSPAARECTSSAGPRLKKAAWSASVKVMLP